MLAAHLIFSSFQGDHYSSLLEKSKTFSQRNFKKNSACLFHKREELQVVLRALENAAVQTLEMCSPV